MGGTCLENIHGTKKVRCKKNGYIRGSGVDGAANGVGFLVGGRLGFVANGGAPADRRRAGSEAPVGRGRHRVGFGQSSLFAEQTTARTSCGGVT